MEKIKVEKYATNQIFKLHGLGVYVCLLGLKKNKYLKKILITRRDYVMQHQIE